MEGGCKEGEDWRREEAESRENKHTGNLKETRCSKQDTQESRQKMKREKTLRKELLCRVNEWEGDRLEDEERQGRAGIRRKNTKNNG